MKTARAGTLEDLADLLTASCRRWGSFLIEVVLS
jgi:hypothetical protein